MELKDVIAVSKVSNLSKVWKQLGLLHGEVVEQLGLFHGQVVEQVFLLSNKNGFLVPINLASILALACLLWVDTRKQGASAGHL